MTYQDRKRLAIEGQNASYLWRLGTTPFQIDLTVLADSRAAIIIETGQVSGDRVQFTEDQAIAIRDMLLELWPIQS